jgi:hypothetical protein
VPQPVRVEAPSRDLAHALMQRLRAFPTELQNGGDVLEVRISLVGSVDRAIVQILDGVDSWLAENDLRSVRVYVGNRVYTLTPPNATGR